MRKTIIQLFDEFIYECEFTRKLRPTTILGYRNSFATFIKLSPNITVETLDVHAVTRFFATLNERKRIVGKGIVKTGIKKSTVATNWSRLNSYFEWLALRGHIATNPFITLRYPTPIYEDKRFLTKEEIEKIFTAILSHSGSAFILKRNLVIFHILLFCGLRKQELLSLQIRDIDIERKTLTVRGETSKSGRTRHLPMHSQVILHLKEYLKERKKYTTQYLIVSRTRDDRLSADGLKHLLKHLEEAAGFHFHLHRFRHTFAVNFLKQSSNIAKLKQLMGHSDIRMTIQYLRCLPTKELRGDIELMNLDNLI